MLHAAQLPLSAMDPATMRAVFNFLATERGHKPAPRAADRVTLAKGIALLRTYPVKAAAIVTKAKAPTVQRERPAVVRDVALQELARVHGYTQDRTNPKKTIESQIFEAMSLNGEWYSVGATFSEVATIVRKRCPGSKITPPVLRRFAHHVRHVADLVEAKRPVPPDLEAFRDVLLPEHRFKSKKGLFDYDRDSKPEPVVAASPAKPKVQRRRPAKPANAGAKRSARRRGRNGSKARR